MAARGQFGDMFGAISSLFTLLAFAAVLAQLRMQKHELVETRNQIQETSASQERAAQAQQKIIELQQSAAEAQQRTAKAQEEASARIAEQVQWTIAAARIASLKARIEIYDVQITENWADGGIRSRLQGERHRMIEELDQVVVRARDNFGDAFS